MICSIISDVTYKQFQSATAAMTAFSAEEIADILSTALTLDDAQREDFLKSIQEAGSHRHAGLLTFLDGTGRQLKREETSYEEERGQKEEKQHLDTLSQKILSSPTP